MYRKMLTTILVLICAISLFWSIPVEAQELASDVFVGPQPITEPGRVEVELSGYLVETTDAFDISIGIGPVGWWMADWRPQIGNKRPVYRPAVNDSFTCSPSYGDDELVPYWEIIHCVSVDGLPHEIGNISVPSLEVQCQDNQGWVSLQVDVGDTRYGDETYCDWSTFLDPLVTIEGDNTGTFGSDNDLEGTLHWSTPYGHDSGPIQWRWFIDGVWTVDWYNDDDIAHYLTGFLTPGVHIVKVEMMTTFDGFEYPIYGWYEFQFYQAGSLTYLPLINR